MVKHYLLLLLCCIPSLYMLSMETNEKISSKNNSIEQEESTQSIKLKYHLVQDIVVRIQKLLHLSENTRPRAHKLSNGMPPASVITIKEGADNSIIISGKLSAVSKIIDIIKLMDTNH